jgi:hypothetical protein
MPVMTKIGYFLSLHALAIAHVHYEKACHRGRQSYAARWPFKDFKIMTHTHTHMRWQTRLAKKSIMVRRVRRSLVFLN